MQANEKILTVANRAFTYGDSLFETILVQDNSPCLPDEHYSRLMKGAALLKFDRKGIPGKTELLNMIRDLTVQNRLSDAVVRWQVFREGSHLSDPGDTGFVISCRPLPPPPPAAGISLCLFRDARKSADMFSGIKHGNYLPYFMGSLHAGEQGCDDAVVFNTYNRICDSCIANIFIIRKGSLLTPALSEGCVEGIYREYLIRELKKKGIDASETEITEEMLMQADEVFLTNCIRGVIPVGRVEDKSLSTGETKKITELLDR